MGKLWKNSNICPEIWKIPLFVLGKLGFTTLWGYITEPGRRDIVGMPFLLDDTHVFIVAKQTLGTLHPD